MKTILINFDAAKSAIAYFSSHQLLGKQENKLISIQELTETYADILALLTRFDIDMCFTGKNIMTHIKHVQFNSDDINFNMSCRVSSDLNFR